MSHGRHTEECLLVKMRLPSWTRAIFEKILFPILHPHWPKKGLQGHKAHTGRMWQTACHASTFLSACVSAKGLLLFVFKWTLNDFDVSVETPAIRESTLASIPCQGLTLTGELL